MVPDFLKILWDTGNPDMWSQLATACLSAILAHQDENELSVMEMSLTAIGEIIDQAPEGWELFNNGNALRTVLQRFFSVTDEVHAAQEATKGWWLFNV
jgi:hypothetical protein